MVWSKLLNLSEVMADSANQDKYQNMLLLARQFGTEARQIDSDVNRQFREHIFFRDRYNLKQRQLFNVLVAYRWGNLVVQEYCAWKLVFDMININYIFSVYNSEVSYCQGTGKIEKARRESWLILILFSGMSTLAGMLLMYLGEEETFWALNILLTDKKVNL